MLRDAKPVASLTPTLPINMRPFYRPVDLDSRIGHELPSWTLVTGRDGIVELGNDRSESIACARAR